MINKENGTHRYFDRNGNEITDGCVIKFPATKSEPEKTRKVYLTERGELGIDATNPAWIDSGRAVPCEYGIYPLSFGDTEICEVVE